MTREQQHAWMLTWRLYYGGAVITSISYGIIMLDYARDLGVAS